MATVVFKVICQTRFCEGRTGRRTKRRLYASPFGENIKIIQVAYYADKEKTHKPKKNCTTISTPFYLPTLGHEFRRVIITSFRHQF